MPPHRERALSPDHPILRGTAQNPDVFFQAREACNPYYLACPTIVQNAMDRFAKQTGRGYHLFDYVGAPDAERVIVLMGSGAGAAEETIEYLERAGRKARLAESPAVPALCRRGFPWRHCQRQSSRSQCSTAPKSRRGLGEPLYQDVVTAFSEAFAAATRRLRTMPRIIGGRYGLSSKEFTPAMVKAVFDELKQPQLKNHFTIGIHDDVTHTSLAYDPDFSTEDPRTVRALFYGLGSDGTVGANKNSIKIIGAEHSELRTGLLCLRFEEVGLRDDVASALRTGSDSLHVPHHQGELRGMPPVPVPGAHGHSARPLRGQSSC